MVDSDVLIECLRGNVSVSESPIARDEEDSIIYYSPVTEAEIYCGVRQGEEQAVTKLFAQLECVNIDRTIGRLAGYLLSKYRKSHGIELGNALIAATAIESEHELCTFNTKHYLMGELRRSAPAEH